MAPDVFVGHQQDEAVTPVHWGTLALPVVAWTARMRRLLVEPPREFAAAVARAGGGTHVAVTEPGRQVVLPRTPARP